MSNLESEASRIARIEQANTLGLSFVKTIILLNGGAVLATLTFMGNADANAYINLSVGSIKLSLSMFLVGITSVLTALLISYSFTATAPGQKYEQYWDRWIIIFNSVLGLISIGAFVFGVIALIVGTEKQ